ncbi:protein CutA homolog [Xenopus laevis]|nr:protein CutA homolog [Xenopus laevis]
MNCWCQRCQGPPQNGHRSTWILVLLVIIGSCMHPILKSIFSQIHSAITGSYISGSHSLVFVNCPNEQIAKEIARGILEKRLAASMNIMPRTSVLSIWDGEIEESTEILLIIRTNTFKISELFAYIR